MTCANGKPRRGRLRPRQGKERQTTKVGTRTRKECPTCSPSTVHALESRRGRFHLLARRLKPGLSAARLLRGNILLGLHPASPYGCLRVAWPQYLFSFQYKNNLSFASCTTHSRPSARLLPVTALHSNTVQLWLLISPRPSCL